MDSPTTGDIVRALITDGKGTFAESTYAIPELNEGDILVKAVMTGVCRSDVDMMNGEFPLLPTSMHGHEGLGINTSTGEYVATRGEPAYADYYVARKETYVTVPELDPKYIIEPVACGVNIETFCRDELITKHHNNQRRMLIIGTGFLARVFYQTVYTYDWDIDVWGSADPDYWGEHLVSKPNGAYDIVVDLKDTKQVLDVELNDNPLIILCSQKTQPITTDLSQWLWKSATIKMPSPRAECFYESMCKAVKLIQQERINLDNTWTKGYNRNNEWQQAFNDAVNRPQGYSRGYIKWD